MTTTQEIHVDGHKLVAISFNFNTTGTPIILLHGITASAYFWMPDLLAPFIQRGPCYALSLPGHHPAVFPDGFQKESLTAEMIAQTLSAAIRQLVGEQQVVLAGHSTGGFSALDIAAYAPDIAQGVISISGFAQGRWTGWLGLYQWLARHGLPGRALFKALFKLGHRHAVYRGVSRFYAADPRKLRAYPYFESAIDHGHLHFKELSPDAMIHYFAAMPDIDISPLLPQIQVPTLVVTGDHDPIVPPTQSQLIAKQVATAELEVIKGSGHFPFFENPGDYQFAIKGWLHRHNGSVN